MSSSRAAGINLAAASAAGVRSAFSADRTIAIASVGNARGADHLAPIGDFALEVFDRLGIALEDGVEADLRKLLLHVGGLHDLVDLGVQPDDDRVGRFGWREEA